MPVYKGTNEVTSGNLYKGSTEIENGYKATNSFYINETTISFVTPTGQGLSYSTPNPQSSTGSPGSLFPSTTFTISGGSSALTGTAVIAGLPPGLTTSQSYNNSGPGNILTITISGTFPTTSYLNTALTISGLSNITYVQLSVDYTGLVIPSTQQGTLTQSVGLPGAINITDNGSVITGQYAINSSISIYVGYTNPTPSQSAQMYQQTVFDRGLYSGGSTLAISNGVTFVNPGGNPPSSVVSYSIPSNNFVINGNTSISVTGRAHSTINNKTWGYSIQATHSGSSSSFVNFNYTMINTAGNSWSNDPGGAGQRSASMTANNSGTFLSTMTPPGGSAAPSKSALIPYNTNPAIGGYTTATGSNDYYFNYGGNTVTTTVTFS